MSIPTLTDPAASITNDASVVEQNDRNIAASINNLENSTNVAQYKGVKVFAASGLLNRASTLDGNYPNYVTGRLVNFFLFWNQHPSTSDVEYLDISGYAIRADSTEAHQPDLITVTLQRSSTVAGAYSNVGGITLNSGATGGLAKHQTTDLSAASYDTSKSFHRVKVEATLDSATGDASWQNFPVFVVVKVRMKSASA